MMDFSLTEALQDQSVLDGMSEQQLDNLIREYPYTSWLHIFKALKKKREGTLTDADVHRAAMYSTDRGKLYEWLELELPILQEDLRTENVEPGTGNEELGTGNEEEGTGKEEVEEGPMIEGKVLQKLVKDGRVEDPEEFIEEEEQGTGKEELGTGNEELGTGNEELGTGNEEEKGADRKEPAKTEATMSKEKDTEDLGQAWSFITWLAEHRSGAEDVEQGTGKEEVKSEEKTKKPKKKKKSGTKKVVSKKSKKKKKKPLKKLIEKSIILDHDIASEPLADLLASQGHIQQALDMYERLSLIFPEKSAFFAQKIKKLKKK